MHNLTDTIIAVSSSAGARTIIRVAGSDAFNTVSRLLGGIDLSKKRAAQNVSIQIEDDFCVRAILYTFPAPASYTGDNICELHCLCCNEAVERIYQKLIDLQCVPADGGEFTYRAYVNGKMDISQAEAVAAIVSGSNQYQIAAAQRVLSGAIEQTVGRISEKILTLLSLVEAGLDFSEEDIEFVSQVQAVNETEQILAEIEKLLAGSISFEQVAEADSVAVTGTPSCGKSSLVNASLGFERSIVSQTDGTTRDVLGHWLKLKKCDCVLFDCAGIGQEPQGLLEQYAQTATIEAAKNACFVVFCVDVSKTDYKNDIEILNFMGITPAIFVATKCDLLRPDELKNKLAELNSLFKKEFLTTSAKTGNSIENLKQRIEQLIISQRTVSPESAEKIAITKRHQQSAATAADNARLAKGELQRQSGETAAMYLRSAAQELSVLSSEHIDEAILGKIFSSFCVGK
ncbi:MAG: 50S ribosome-binding GTPase [Anaerohalosphaeraceae bacterium]|nr:50S ribosome-binding GTPase [Anaerohalosphaeraceae bacterium]